MHNSVLNTPKKIFFRSGRELQTCNTNLKMPNPNELKLLKGSLLYMLDCIEAERNTLLRHRRISSEQGKAEYGLGSSRQNLYRCSFPRIAMRYNSRKLQLSLRMILVQITIFMQRVCACHYNGAVSSIGAATTTVLSYSKSPLSTAVHRRAVELCVADVDGTSTHDHKSYAMTLRGGFFAANIGHCRSPHPRSLDSPIAVCRIDGCAGEHACAPAAPADAAAAGLLPARAPDELIRQYRQAMAAARLRRPPKLSRSVEAQ